MRKISNLVTKYPPVAVMYKVKVSSLEVIIGYSIIGTNGNRNRSIHLKSESSLVFSCPIWLLQTFDCCLNFVFTWIFNVLLYQAIADLTKALEFEPDSPDILHERGCLNRLNSSIVLFTSFFFMHNLCDTFQVCWAITSKLTA